MDEKQPSVRIESTPLGRGVFATQRFEAQQLVGEVCGSLIHDADYEGSEYAIDVGNERTLEPEAPFRFLNHSCQPNCELYWSDEEQDSLAAAATRLWVHALHDIAAGDELTIDYAWPADAAIPCGCQSAACRGWIVDADDLENVLARTDVVGSG